MSRLTTGLFTSNTDNWATPKDLFNELNNEFHFELDVCASEENHKCERYFTKDQDGLNQVWTGKCFMNPPYGREIGAWVRKAYETARGGQGTVVCLLPARTDTNWWHKYVSKAKDIRFMKGRVHFNDGKQGAPFPSVIVVFRPTASYEYSEMETLFK